MLPARDYSQMNEKFNNCQLMVSVYKFEISILADRCDPVLYLQIFIIFVSKYRYDSFRKARFLVIERTI